MTDGEPETVDSASLQKIKSIKNPIKRFCFVFIFYFIKSETSDSFVSHFDGHFAYLKTLDFYFKSTEAISFRTPTTGLLGTGTLDGRIDFHTAFGVPRLNSVNVQRYLSPQRP